MCNTQRSNVVQNIERVTANDGMPAFSYGFIKLCVARVALPLLLVATAPRCPEAPVAHAVPLERPYKLGFIFGLSSVSVGQISMIASA